MNKPTNRQRTLLTAWMALLFALTLLAGCGRSAAQSAQADAHPALQAEATPSQEAASPLPTDAATKRATEPAAPPTADDETPTASPTTASQDGAKNEAARADAAPTGQADQDQTDSTDAVQENDASASSTAAVAIPPVVTAAPAPVPTVTLDRPLDETINVLVLGSDKRARSTTWRTDVIMIVALDMKNGRVGVISIPRDVYVSRMPGHQANKINTVDYFGETDEPGGGPKLLSRIIEDKMGIPIHHYIRFNFETFREVVDALDGVEVKFDCAFYGDLGGRSKWMKLQLDPGVHRLNGDEAIIYVRSRAVGGDLDRAKRQQRFIWSIREQVLHENLLPKLPALYGALKGSVQTDIGLLEAVRMARFALTLNPADVHAFVISPPDMLGAGWAGRMSVFFPRWSVIADRVQRIFDTPPFVETNEIANSKGRPCQK